MGSFFKKNDTGKQGFKAVRSKPDNTEITPVLVPSWINTVKLINDKDHPCYHCSTTLRAVSFVIFFSLYGRPSVKFQSDKLSVLAECEGSLSLVLMQSGGVLFSLVVQTWILWLSVPEVSQQNRNNDTTIPTAKPLTRHTTPLTPGLHLPEVSQQNWVTTLFDAPQHNGNESTGTRSEFFDRKGPERKGRKVWGRTELWLRAKENLCTGTRAKTDMWRRRWKKYHEEK